MSENPHNRFPYQLIDVLIRTMESRDVYLVNHQKMVARLARCLAQELGMSADEVEGIRVAAQLHDIGKIALPSELLSKLGALQYEEFELIKTHVKRGLDILDGVEFPWPILTMIGQHHERLDGSGYPHGLRDEICPGARILAVADVVNAVTRARPYRGAMGIDTMLAIFRDDRASGYDRNVVGALYELIERKDACFMESL
jgi:putative nucleotidyltransferase with HDIG domain